MGVEKYIAAASLGLFVMFAAEIITLYAFLIDPPSLPFEIEPAPKLLQFISIGVAPALILAGTSYLMIRRYGSKLIGSFIMAGGAVLLVGMTYSYTLLDRIGPEYMADAVVITPPLFMAVSIPVMITGALLFRLKKPKKPKSYI